MPPTEVPPWRRLGLSLRRLEPARDSSPNANTAGERSLATNSDSTSRPRRFIKRVSYFQEDPSDNLELEDSEKDNHSSQVAFMSMKPVRTFKTKPGLGIDKSLPPPASIENIFVDMASNASQLGSDSALKELRGRTVNTTTASSGTELQFTALQLLSKALEDGSEAPSRINYVSSSESDPIKQELRKRNFRPNFLFRDVSEFHTDNAETATTVYGAQVPILEHIDSLVVGFMWKVRVLCIKRRSECPQDGGKPNDTNSAARWPEFPNEIWSAIFKFSDDSRSLWISRDLFGEELSLLIMRHAYESWLMHLSCFLCRKSFSKCSQCHVHHTSQLELDLRLGESVYLSPTTTDQEITCNDGWTKDEVMGRMFIGAGPCAYFTSDDIQFTFEGHSLVTRWVELLDWYSSYYIV